MAPEDLTELRRLHAATKEWARLTPDEAARYASLSARLLQAVAVGQNAAIPARHRPREGVRIRRALRAELSWGCGEHRVLTMDVGPGGFAALLGATPPRNAIVRVRLFVSFGDPLELSARVVGARERRGCARVSFAFGEPAAADRVRLDRCLLDDALTELAFARRKAG
jgi:hypothetical protein